jgi:succinoglycan biosynthesis transport protein ExoP
MAASLPSARRDPELLSTRRAQEISSAQWERDAFGPLGYMDHVQRRNRSDDNDSKFGFTEIRNALGRHKKLIAACVVIVTASVAILVAFLPKEYVGEAMVSIENQKTEIADLRDTVTRGFLENMQVPSEAEVLRAPDLALRVVDELNLTDNAEFRQSTDQASSLLRFVPADWLAAIGIVLEEPKQPPDPRSLRSAVADAVLNRLTIVSDPHSYIIRIRMRSRDPAFAATLANAYADAYLASQEESKAQVGEHANTWLSGRLEELRRRAEESEQAAEDFRRQHNLLKVDGSGLTLVSQQIRDLNAQLVSATADRVQKEAQLARVKAAMASPAGVGAVSNVLASPLIQKLSEEEAKLKEHQASLGSRFLSGYPQMGESESQLSDVQRSLANETKKIVASLSSDLAGARARESNLQARIDDLAKDYNRDSAAGVQLANLQRQADASTKLYQQFLDRFNALSVQQGGETPDAHIVSHAQIPDYPSFPRKGLMLAAALFGSTLFGAGLACLLELFDKGVRSERQIESATGIASAGLVPAVKSRAIDIVLRERSSVYSEAIRNIGVALQIDGTKVVLITSALQGEGKSVFASSLACTVADDGHRVLLVDCDLRRPAVHRMLNRPWRAGIRELILGEIAEDAAIARDSDTEVAYIAASNGIVPRKPSPQELFGSKTFEQLLAKWRDEYDLIVLDAPPVLAVSDTLILDRLADTTLLVLHWASTPLAIFEAAARKLRTTSARAPRVVLSRVDLRSYTQYEFGKAYDGVYARSYGPG